MAVRKYRPGAIPEPTGVNGSRVTTCPVGPSPSRAVAARLARASQGAPCSARIRRISRMTAGWSWQRWPDEMSDSDSTPSRWALSYGTWPSLPPAPGGSRRSAMMEWALIVGASPSSSRPMRIGDRHSSSSMLVGSPLRKRSVSPRRGRSSSPSGRSTGAHATGPGPKVGAVPGDQSGEIGGAHGSVLGSCWWIRSPRLGSVASVRRSKRLKHGYDLDAQAPGMSRRAAAADDLSSSG